jgi:hypothetical protein
MLRKRDLDRATLGKERGGRLKPINGVPSGVRCIPYSDVAKFGPTAMTLLGATGKRSEVAQQQRAAFEFDAEPIFVQDVDGIATHFAVEDLPLK